MKWIVVKRNYHGEEAAAMVRWIVGVEGQTRGICECWDEDTAKAICHAMDAWNTLGFDFPQESAETAKVPSIGKNG